MLFDEYVVDVVASIVIATVADDNDAVVGGGVCYHARMSNNTLFRTLQDYVCWWVLLKFYKFHGRISTIFDHETCYFEPFNEIKKSYLT